MTDDNDIWSAEKEYGDMLPHEAAHVVIDKLRAELAIAEQDIEAYKRSMKRALFAVTSAIADRTELSAEEILELFKQTRPSQTTCWHCGQMLPGSDDAIRAHVATCQAHPAVIRAVEAERQRDKLLTRFDTAAWRTDCTDCAFRAPGKELCDAQNCSDAARDWAAQKEDSK